MRSNKKSEESERLSQTKEYFFSMDPSVQAILDKLPRAKTIERSRSDYHLEAEVYGDEIKMFLLNQGAKVKVVVPEEFVREMGKVITKCK